jgi:hypothetical protein
MSGRQRPRPEQLLKPYFVEHPSDVGWRLQQKYSDPPATIGEDSVDYTFFSNQQLGLRRLLDQANASGCLAYNPDAWTWASRSTPSPLPQPPGG